MSLFSLPIPQRSSGIMTLPEVSFTNPCGQECSWSCFVFASTPTALASPSLYYTAYPLRLQAHLMCLWPTTAVSCTGVVY